MQRQQAAMMIRAFVVRQAASRLHLNRCGSATNLRRRAALTMVKTCRRAFSQAVEVTSTSDLSDEKANSSSSRVVRQLVNGATRSSISATATPSSAAAAAAGSTSAAASTIGRVKTKNKMAQQPAPRITVPDTEVISGTATPTATPMASPIKERRKRTTSATTSHRRRTISRQPHETTAAPSSASLASSASSPFMLESQNHQAVHATPPTAPSVNYAYARAHQQEQNTKTQQQRPRMVFKDGKPLITVMGLGGAGCNAVNNMISSQLEGVEFVVANTDCQALGRSLASRKITLGKEVTKGLGAGSKPQLGKVSAEMQRHEIEQCLKDSNMLFITGGMGGGTCTGAAPVVASIAREMGILTVGVVSTPFRSEGPNRTRLANAGVKDLAKYVDTLIIVPNQNLLALSNKKTTMLEAFRYADDVLLEGVKGVTDLIVRPGLINLDFADIRTIMSDAGRAIMGSGHASGPNRAEQAAEKALVNPLLGELPTESAQGLLVTIRGGEDLTLFEVDKTMEIIRSRVADDANIIFGTCYDQSLEGSIYVSIFVSGIQTDVISPPVIEASSTSSASTTSAPLSDSSTSKSAQNSIEAQAETDESTERRGFFRRIFSF